MDNLKKRKLVVYSLLAVTLLSVIFAITNSVVDYKFKHKLFETLGGLQYEKDDSISDPNLAILIITMFAGAILNFIFDIFAFVYFKKGGKKQFRKWPYIVIVIAVSIAVLAGIISTVTADYAGSSFVQGSNTPPNVVASISSLYNSDYKGILMATRIISYIIGVIEIALGIAALALISKEIKKTPKVKPQPKAIPKKVEDPAEHIKQAFMNNVITAEEYEKKIKELEDK